MEISQSLVYIVQRFYKFKGACKKGLHALQEKSLQSAIIVSALLW